MRIFSDGSSNWPYGINDGETHFQAGLTQDDIDALINSEREFRDKEADILNLKEFLKDPETWRNKYA